MYRIIFFIIYGRNLHQTKQNTFKFLFALNKNLKPDNVMLIVNMRISGWLDFTNHGPVVAIHLICHIFSPSSAALVSLPISLLLPVLSAARQSAPQPPQYRSYLTGRRNMRYVSSSASLHRTAGTAGCNLGF